MIKMLVHRHPMNSVPFCQNAQLSTVQVFFYKLGDLLVIQQGNSPPNCMRDSTPKTGFLRDEGLPRERQTDVLPPFHKGSRGRGG
jgi:hypothetical protein